MCCLIRRTRSAAPPRRARSSSPPVRQRSSAWQAPSARAERGYGSDGEGLLGYLEDPSGLRATLSLDPSVSDPLWFGDAYQPLRSGIVNPPEAPAFDDAYDGGGLPPCLLCALASAILTCVSLRVHALPRGTT